MKRLKNGFDHALDAWSDFAIDCWLYALRIGVFLIAIFYFWGLTGRWATIDWSAIGLGTLSNGFLFVFGIAIVLALVARIERAFAGQKSKRQKLENGGRTKPSRRPKRRQWGNRKRKRKA